MQSLGQPSQTSNPNAVLPDFVIIGAQKAGTSTMYAVLCNQPFMKSATEKELQYFSKRYNLGLDWYKQQFPANEDKTRSWITGEATPYYLFHPLAPKRLKETIPNAKLIVMLRNPIDRAMSHYYHERRLECEPFSFEDAVAAEPERLRGEVEKILAEPFYLSDEHQQHSYLERGKYADQLLRWFELFPREQFHICTAGDLKKNPEETYAAISKFLGVGKIDYSKIDDVNVLKYEPMHADTRQRLTEYFKPHNEKLYELLGRNLGW
ncbi:MAG TPA: sulfotransferase domain-containing protein [Planktothrix sp.]|jgi:hypothetical protein